jgi:hypothetical protein
MLAQTLDNTKQINDIYDFVRDYFKDASEEEIKNIIWNHWFYGTIDSVYRHGKIVACVRWNISSDFRICEVLDLIIAPGENGFRLLKHLIARNWHRFPLVKYIKFSRNRKYSKKEPSLYRISKMLHLRED